MRYLAIFFLFATLVACKNVEQYKAGIESLGTTWDSTTSAVTDFTTMVSAEQTSLQNITGGINIDSMAMAKLKPEVQNQINTAKNGLAGAAANYTTMMTEVSSFVSEWSKKGEEVKALKDGLAAGKLEGDVAKKIADLTSFATEAGNKLNTWKANFTKAQESSKLAQEGWAKVSSLLPIKK